jgi:diguanylate cyclase (GGDEF)-like protein
MRSFQAKLALLFVAVLVLLQAATLIAVHVAGQATLRENIADELRVGSRLFDRILEGRGRQLSETVRVLASDFAFREAVASGDEPTIHSVLGNHRTRIDADAAMLIALDGTVVSDTLDRRFTGRAFPLPDLVRRASEGDEATAIVTFDQRPFQLVIVPVIAPRTIAYVCMGFVIDRGVLVDVRNLTSLDVSLLNATGSSAQIVSTLPQDRVRDLATLAAENEQFVERAGGDYQALIHPLPTADRSRIYTVLERSVAESARPWRRLELQIFVLSSVVLVLALIAAILFARGISKPLEELAEGAQRIEHGDYASAIKVDQRDEIGRLATALDRMRTGIAEREVQILHQATHDTLTGLPNRTLFLARLGSAITWPRPSGESVAMIMMDLDRFKEINDTLGHHFGDQLLIEIGRRLAQTLPESDTVARLGGDEFAVMFTVREVAGAVAVAQRIADSLKLPFVLAGVSIDVDASMGIALSPLHAVDAETLLKRADVAMYDAKEDHTSFAIYETGRDEHSLRRLAILSDLRHSIERGELELHYQPKIDVRSERVAHAEALVRWRHSVHGFLRPDEFIPLAEQSGNIGMITKWVLARAIRDCGEWNRSGLDISIAVNLSALDLFDSELPIYISGLLAEVSLPPSKLVLEITESAVMKDPAYALKILRDLKSRGVMLAIDDYGTGYSSLAHLRRLPVDELKIDKSFVLALGNGATRDDVVIVRSTIELGHNIGLKVIAEGVENAKAWNILKDLGCDMAQGYFVSKPLPEVDFRNWMEGRVVGSR